MLCSPRSESRLDVYHRFRDRSDVKVISYNLRKNSASGELIALAEEYDPDLLCLQECDTLDLPAEVGLLHLADSTTRIGWAWPCTTDGTGSPRRRPRPSRSRSRCTTSCSHRLTND